MTPLYDSKGVLSIKVVAPEGSKAVFLDAPGLFLGHFLLSGSVLPFPAGTHRTHVKINLNQFDNMCEFVRYRTIEINTMIGFLIVAFG